MKALRRRKCSEIPISHTEIPLPLFESLAEVPVPPALDNSLLINLLAAAFKKKGTQLTPDDWRNLLDWAAKIMVSSVLLELLFKGLLLVEWDPKTRTVILDPDAMQVMADKDSKRLKPRGRQFTRVDFMDTAGARKIRRLRDA